VSESRRVGILGGTFDPIHCGHVDLGVAAQRALGLTRVLVVPASAPPHRFPPLASAFHRFAMVAQAAAGRPGWRASALEVQRGGTSYTSQTLQQLHEFGYSHSELFFILGGDAFTDIEAWRDYPQLLDRANFAVVSRPGFQIDDLSRRLPALASRIMRLSSGALGTLGTGVSGSAHPTGPCIFLIHAQTADVSSTAIRQRRARGEPITGLVAPAVEQHIEQHGLYRSETPDHMNEVQPIPSSADRLHGQS
jgi:nicotinate-nucleotide adenylyltransferase